MTSKLVGKTIQEQFRVDAFIDAGAMGSVFRVWDLKRNVPLAMKVLHSDLADDPSMLKHFQREARALQKLAHPNIIAFYGLYQTAEFAFLLEQFIDGPTLKNYLKHYNGRALPDIEALSFLKAICSALGYAHANNVVHCDVKAANVMIDRGGNIYLADFGIARHADSTTTTMAGAGTPAYMAPEQIEAKVVGPATDIYAVGVLLYEMLTGQRPFRGTERNTESAGATANERIRYAHLNLEPPDPRTLNPALSPKLSKVLLKALAKAPQQRYQSCQEMLAAVCAAYGTQSEQIPERISTGRIAWYAAEAAPATPPVNKTPPGRGFQIPATSNPAQGGWTPPKNSMIFIGLGALVAVVLLLFAFARPAAPLTFARTSAPAVPANPNQPTVRPVLAEVTRTQVFQEETKAISATTSEFSPPTWTPQPTYTRFPTSTPPFCPGTKPQMVKVGQRAFVCTRSDWVYLRETPSMTGRDLFHLTTGTKLSVVDGPACVDGFTWWKVGGDSVPVQGWVREGYDDKDPYFICPLNP